MAVQTGISGMSMGDGAGGKIALSIKEMVLRILSDQHLSYYTATIANLHSLTDAGTAIYYVPEVLQTENYGTGNTAAQNPQAGTVSVNLDKRIDVKYELETFDLSRLANADTIAGQIAVGVAFALQARFNADFLKFVTDQFRTGATLNAQKLVLSKITSTDTALNPDDMYGDWLSIEYQIAKINQMYNKQVLGVPKAEVLAVLSPICDIGIIRAFRDQPNQIGTWQVAATLAGKKIGNLKYSVDTMFQNKFDAGTSFSKDTSYDFTKFGGILLHNEAVAFPINLNTITQVINPENGNIRFIAKAQYGAGILRPKLIWALVTENNIPAAK